MTHGHGHHHGPATPVSTRVRRIVVSLLLPLILATAAGVLVLYPWGGQRVGNALGVSVTTVDGVVTAVAASDCGGGGKQCAAVTVRLDDGHVVTEPMPLEPSTPRFSVADKVVLGYNGGDANDPGSYQLVDFQRGTPMLLLAVLFSIAVLVLGRWQGVKALGALALTFVVLIGFILPAILAGRDPLWVAVVGSGLIMFAVLYLTHGLSARTSTAVIGTLVSLGLIGLLGALFAGVASLSGLDEDTANLVGLLGHGIDSRGLLLAGVVIGSVGVLDDVTVTQTSAVWELRRANPRLDWRQLYAAGLRIGRDHMSSAVNTLVMAYAGAGLPLLLAYSVTGRGFGEVLTSETIAQELLRTLVGSIGLVASVPVTTLLAALIVRQEKIPDHVVGKRRPRPLRPDDYPTEPLEL